MSYEENMARSPNAANFKIKSLQDLLFYTLFTLKSGITFDTAAFLMQFDVSRAHRQFVSGVDLMHYTLDAHGYLPVRSIESPVDFASIFPELDTIIIDATEQPVQRPQDQEYQKEAYSGKKKRHTYKSMIISSIERYIVYVSNAYVGSTHDYALLKAEFDPDLPWFKDVSVRVDLGYQGFYSDYPHAQSFLPTKKTRGGQLSEAQKQANKQLAKERIRVAGTPVEHSIGGIKRYDILSSVSRIRDIDLYDKILASCAGLWNFFITR